MPSDTEVNMPRPDENLPSYTQDTSPPLYAVDSDEEDWAGLSHGMYDVEPFRNTFLPTSQRHEDRDIELGDINRERMDRERFFRRMAASSPPHVDFATLSTREQYEFTNTERVYMEDASTSRLTLPPHSSTPNLQTAVIDNPSRRAQGRNHAWVSPPSQSPPDYYTSEILTAAAATSAASAAASTPDAPSTSTSAQNTLGVSAAAPIPAPASATDALSPSSLAPLALSNLTPNASSPHIAAVLMRTSHLRIEVEHAAPAPTPMPASARPAPARAATPARPRQTAVATRPRRRRSDDERTCRSCIRWLVGLACLAAIGYLVYLLEK